MSTFAEDMEAGRGAATPYHTNSTSSSRPDTPSPYNELGPVRLLQDSNKGTASPLTNELLIAARKGYSKELERILTENSSTATTTVDRHGRNCLHLACHYGHLQTVAIILKMQVLDINCPSRRGFTPLHEASAEGHLQIVLLLLAMGAYYKARSKEGWTALMSTCYNGHYEIARILLGIGIDVNATNTNRFTALHVAAWKGNTSIIELLIREGAVTSMETQNGKTALDVAKEEKQQEAVIILQAASVRDSEKPFLRIAALENQLRLVQDKLKQIHEQHEKSLNEERKKTKEDIAQIKRHYEQVTAADQNEIEKLKETVECLKQEGLVSSNGYSHHDGIESSRSTPEIQVTEHSPPTQKDIKKKKKKTKDLLEPSLTPSLIKKPHRNSIGDLSMKQSPLLISQGGKTDAKTVQETIDTLEGVGDVRLANEGTTRRSFDSIRLVPRGSSDKLTITQMVEENFKSGSMAAIKQQIKADGLTPKINRKFNRSLPAMPEEFIKTSDQKQKNILGNEN